MNKFATLAVVLAFTFGAVACDKTSKTGSEDPKTPKTGSEDPKTPKTGSAAE